MIPGISNSIIKELSALHRKGYIKLCPAQGDEPTG